MNEQCSYRKIPKKKREEEEPAYSNVLCSPSIFFSNLNARAGQLDSNRAGATGGLERCGRGVCARAAPAAPAWNPGRF